MTVFENVVVAAAFGGECQRSLGLRVLRGSARPLRPRRQGQPARRQPDAARSQAPRAGARARDQAARAAARRGRRRPDRARMRDAGRADQATCAQPACRSSGSSTSCMRCSPTVDRLLVLHGGKFIAEGEPHAVIKSPQVRGDLHGDRGRCLSPCSTCAASTPIYGDFQALFGVSLRVERRRGGGGDRRQRRRQDHAAENHRRHDGAAPRRHHLRRRSRSAARRRSTCSSAASRWCRKAGGCFRRSRSRKISDRRPLAPPRPVDARARLSAVPGPGRAAAPARRRAVRRPAADGRDRPRADVEPAPVAVRRDQPRPRADRGARHLRAAAGNRGGRPVADLVEQDIAQALKAARQVYCLQEGRVALQGAARELTRETISAAYFGV